MSDGTFNVLKIKNKVKVCPVENFSTKNRERCMDRCKSSGNNETKSSGYKGPRGPSVTRISIIPIKICAQNFLDNKMQLQS